MDLFWGVPALLLGVGLLAAIGHPDFEQTRAYGAGWGVPPVWAMIWAAITTVWVKIALRGEHREWRREYERGLLLLQKGEGEGAKEKEKEDGAQRGENAEGEKVEVEGQLLDGAKDDTARSQEKKEAPAQVNGEAHA